MKYKILAIILAIAIAVSGFSIKTSAIEPVTATIIGSILASLASGLIVSLTDKASDSLAASNTSTDTITSVKYSTQQLCSDSVERLISTKGVSVVYDSGTDSYYASFDSSLTGYDLELAQTIAGTVNSIPDFSNKCKLYSDPISTSIDAYFYEDLKTAVGQATSEFTQKVFIETSKENGLTLMANGALPVYNFDFVGPMQPGLELPTMATTSNKFLLDGIILYRPVVPANNGSFSEQQVSNFGFKLENAMYQKVPVDFAVAGTYAVYNGDIFYCPAYTKPDSNGYAYFPGSDIYNAGYYKNANGDYLSDVLPSGVHLEDCPIGIYSSNDSSLYSNRPSVSIAVDDNTFSSSISPGTVEIPRNEGEQAVTNGLSSGIISSNPQLVLDENGNIARVDGIDTAKLMELLEMIANNGNISFDSIEGYLEHITHLLTVSNADANTLNTVVTNLNELAKSQSKSVSDINTAVQAIAKAFEKTEEGENADTDFSGLVIEHTGLVEATAIVDGMPIVQQSRLLFSNLVQGISDGSTSNAPNFVFYWDSNKDGKTERYNVLDLSFMDQPLTNSNLEYKGRFNDNLTIRQFVQYLIILLCYVSFFIKILKRLPSLFGGAGETHEDLKNTKVEVDRV